MRQDIEEIQLGTQGCRRARIAEEERGGGQGGTPEEGGVRQGTQECYRARIEAAPSASVW
jgi:hypothetical protein